jgi:hypothetical protein
MQSALRIARVTASRPLSGVPGSIVASQSVAGSDWMNTFRDGAPELPFGGYRESGLGRELGRAAVEDYTETKTLHIHHAGRTAWWGRLIALVLTGHVDHGYRARLLALAGRSSWR